MADIKRKIAGIKAKNNGRAFEARLEAAFEYYRLRGEALIEKTPEPVKQLGAMDKQGRFLACYEKRAQPDYKGVYLSTGDYSEDVGACIVFEAKYTSGMKIPLNRVAPHQLNALLEYEKLGAEAFIIVGFGDGSVARYSANKWDRYMRDGCASFAPDDGFPIPQKGGILKVLEGLV